MITIGDASRSRPGPGGPCGRPRTLHTQEGSDLEPLRLIAQGERERGLTHASPAEAQRCARSAERHSNVWEVCGSYTVTRQAEQAFCGRSAQRLMVLTEKKGNWRQTCPGPLGSTTTDRALMDNTHTANRLDHTVGAFDEVDENS